MYCATCSKMLILFTVTLFLFILQGGNTLDSTLVTLSTFLLFCLLLTCLKLLCRFCGFCSLAPVFYYSPVEANVQGRPAELVLGVHYTFKILRRKGSRSVIIFIISSMGLDIVCSHRAWQAIGSRCRFCYSHRGLRLFGGIVAGIFGTDRCIMLPVILIVLG